jgi:HlyD family secretion protein
MDRELASNIRRQARLKTALKVAAPLIVVAIALVMLPGWLRPALRRDRVRTAIVTAGPIDATISASGLVVPAIERVISSPLDARVLRILQRPGAPVRRGDAVLELDVNESQVAFEKSENDLKVKDNQQRQTRLSYEKALVELDGRIKVKALELETRRATLDGHRKLAGMGLLSKEELRASELAVQQAEIELAQFKDERLNAERATALQIEGLQLERATLDREVGERRRQLDLATTKADRDGVLTWVVTQEGALVRRGDVLARIADLSSFRVDASASDVHAGAIRPGLRAIVHIDTLSLDGQVSDVYPSVENGSVRFTVALSEDAHASLRPNLRADVEVVTDQRARALTLKRGPFADNGAATQVFVIRGNRAVRTAIQPGIGSFDAIEVRSGLAAGDEVIISDMRDYMSVAEVAIR